LMLQHESASGAISMANANKETPLLTFIQRQDDKDLPLRQQILTALVQDPMLSSRGTLDGDTVLHLIQHAQDAKLITPLIPPQQFMERNVNEIFPLHLACSSGNTPVVKIYLDRLCAAKCAFYALAKDDGGRTCLHLASQNSHLEVVQVLLDHPAFGTQLMDEKSNRGNTALHLAAQENHIDLVRLLLSRNALTTVRNGQDKVAADLASPEVQAEIDRHAVLTRPRLFPRVVAASIVRTIVVGGMEPLFVVKSVKVRR
jgi:hypothetical protein